MRKGNYILLSFDVEEFDLPLEYGHNMSMEEQMQVGYSGTTIMQNVLQQHNIACTLFTTAHYAIHHKEQVSTLAEKHEIASHTYYHSQFEEADLLNSKNTLEAICKQRVTGLRMPRMQQVNIEAVKAAGYEYDASINPTWIPGRYNNRHLPRTLYQEESIVRIPASVTPHFRIPLFWLAFKNMPLWLFTQFTLQTLHKDGYVSLYLHPWEFTDISSYPIPAYTKRHAGKKLEDKLHTLIRTLQKHGEFITMQQFKNIQSSNIL
jgi:hypothetical protein